ncbi:protein phosphatase 1 regulatory subunit 12A-like [Clytia hemisphaerica]|uniref:protein phosphatase 1 regulatory subunit 12A-like n=1 Tax=Clytia hemisphaerica TaxID=252671 RepID=UPI0034D3D9A8
MTSSSLHFQSSSDTGDTKDLQRKLDQAVKEVEEYKSKYEKMKKEKEELEKQLSQYKEDIDKVQDLKSDNIRLKDENGALIRVISNYHVPLLHLLRESWIVRCFLVNYYIIIIAEVLLVLPRRDEPLIKFF